MAEHCQIGPLRICVHLKGPVSQRESQGIFLCDGGLGPSHTMILMPRKIQKLVRDALRLQGRGGPDCPQDEYLSMVSNLSNAVKCLPFSRWDASFGSPPHRSKPASCPELSLDSEKSVRCCNKAGKWLF